MCIHNFTCFLGQNFFTNLVDFSLGYKHSICVAISSVRVNGKWPSPELTWLLAELNFLSVSMKDCTCPQLPFASFYMGLCNVTDCINIPSGEKSKKKHIPKCNIIQETIWSLFLYSVDLKQTTGSGHTPQENITQLFQLHAPTKAPQGRNGCIWLPIPGYSPSLRRSQGNNAGSQPHYIHIQKHRETNGSLLFTLI